MAMLPSIPMLFPKILFPIFKNVRPISKRTRVELDLSNSANVSAPPSPMLFSND
jgi:hypothetical protein